MVLPSARLVFDVAPVPVNEMVVGLFAALLVTVTDPVRVPLAVGLNVTLIVQLAPAARLDPHVFVCAKSPLATIELIAAAAFPVFCTVTVCAALVAPTVVLPNVRLDGLVESVALVPPPPPPPPAAG
jgi:hypothetical protein